MTTEPAPPKTAEIMLNRDPELLAPASNERTIKVLKLFQEFKANVLDKDDYVFVQGKRLIKKSGWLKYALACSLSLEVREEKVERLPNEETVYHYVYRAIHPSGRFADAVGSASSKERSFTHLVHDVRALAQTRAMERSISNLVGGGELGAEEMTDIDSNQFPKEHVSKALNYHEMPWEPYPSDPQNAWIFANVIGVKWLLDELLKATDRRLQVNIEGRDYELSLGYVRDDPDPRFIRRVLLKEATQ